MPATPKFGLRYPNETDTPDVPRDIANLANDVETALGPGTAPPSGIAVGEAEVWNGTTWARSTTQRLGIQSLAGYPADASKTLDGSGTWRAPSTEIAISVSGANTDIAWPAANPVATLFAEITTAGGSLRTVGAPPAGTGQQLVLVNVAGSGSVTVLHQASAGAGAKFSNRTGLQLVLQVHESVTYEWDGTSWVEVVRDRAIIDEDVSAAAAIAYAKLALAGSILNSDISPSAAIAYSKLALAGQIKDADIAAAAAIAISKLAGFPSNASLALFGDGTWKAPSGVPSGAIFPFAGAAAPAGFLLCDGSAVSRTTYATLFAAIGTAYGAGDGSTTFGLPNLQGRVPVGKNAATFGTLGAVGGEETHALLLGEMPNHDHGGSTVAVSAGTPSGTIASTFAGNALAAHTHAFAGSALAAHGHTFTGVYYDHIHYMSQAVADFRWDQNFRRDSTAKGVVDIANLVGSSYAGGYNVISGYEMSPANDGTTPVVAGSINSVSAGTPAGTNASVSAGTPSGTVTSTFTGAALPTHAHTINAQGGSGAGNATLAHNNLQPYQVVNYIVKT